MNRNGVRTLDRLTSEFWDRLEFEDLRVGIEFNHRLNLVPHGSNRDVARWLKLAERFAT